MHLGPAGVAFAIVLILPTSACAAMLALRADLDGANMVPATASSGAGYVRATYDTATRRLSWSGSYSGLSSKVTRIAFHGPAGPAATAGITQRIRSLAAGSATLSEAEAADLIGGYWSIIVHTRSHPAGEIRGQVLRGE
jgi:hypothetical protein